MDMDISMDNTQNLWIWIWIWMGNFISTATLDMQVERQTYILITIPLTYPGAK